MQIFEPRHLNIHSLDPVIVLCPPVILPALIYYVEFVLLRFVVGDQGRAPALLPIREIVHQAPLLLPITANLLCLVHLFILLGANLVIVSHRYKLLTIWLHRGTRRLRIRVHLLRQGPESSLLHKYLQILLVQRLFHQLQSIGYFYDLVLDYFLVYLGLEIAVPVQLLHFLRLIVEQLQPLHQFLLDEILLLPCFENDGLRDLDFSEPVLLSLEIVLVTVMAAMAAVAVVTVMIV